MSVVFTQHDFLREPPQELTIEEESLQWLREFIINVGRLIVGLPKKITSKEVLRSHRGPPGGDLQ